MSFEAGERASADAVGWRKPRRSPPGPAAACVQAARAKGWPNGTVTLDAAGVSGKPVILRPATDGSPVTDLDHVASGARTAGPPGGLVEEPWTGSLDFGRGRTAGVEVGRLRELADIAAKVAAWKKPPAQGVRPDPGAERHEYSRTFLEHLRRGLHVEVREEDPVAVASMETLIGQVEEAGPGAAAYVQNGAAGRDFVLYHAADQGVFLIDPTAPGHYTIRPTTGPARSATAGGPGPATALGPLTDARAVVIDPRAKVTERSFEDELTSQVNKRLGERAAVGPGRVLEVWERLKEERTEAALPKNPSGRADVVAQAIQLGDERSEEAFRGPGGAAGFEAETAIEVTKPDGTPLPEGLLLATHDDGHRLVVDERYFVVDTEGRYHGDESDLRAAGKEFERREDTSIVEAVSKEYGVHGDKDRRRTDRSRSVWRIEQALYRLSRGHGRTLGEVLDGRDGWHVAPGQGRNRLHVLPLSVGYDVATGGVPVFPQESIGVALAGMHRFLEHIAGQFPPPSSGMVWHAQVHLDAALAFADEIAADFVTKQYGIPISPHEVGLLGDIEQVEAIRGFMALVYTQIVAIAEHRRHGSVGTLKNFAAIVSRTSLAGIRRIAPDLVRSYLNTNAHTVRDSLFARHRSTVRSTYGAAVSSNVALTPVANGTGTLAEYLDTALLRNPARSFDQGQVMDMNTSFAEADDNHGLLDLGLIVLEARGAGAQLVGIKSMGGKLAALEAQAHRAYEHAMRVRRHSLGPAYVSALLGTDQAKILRKIWERVRKITEGDSGRNGVLLSFADVSIILQGLREANDGRSSSAVYAADAALAGLDQRLRTVDLSGRSASTTKRLRKWVDSAHDDIGDLRGDLGVGAGPSGGSGHDWYVPPYGGGYSPDPPGDAAGTVLEAPRGDAGVGAAALGEGALELERATVGPLTTDTKNAWFRAFDVRRYRRADGETVSRLVVRIAWRNPGVVSEEELRAFEDRIRDDVHAVWNAGARLENGDLLRVEVEFAGSAGQEDAPHQIVEIRTERTRSSYNTWWIDDTRPGTWAHEVAHHLGAADEYRELGAEPRPVYTDGSLLASLSVDDRARPRVDVNVAGSVRAGTGRLYVPPRLLRELSAGIEAALRRGRSTAGGERSSAGAEGPPQRAGFSLEVRRAALYGDRHGAGGHLPPGPMSDRPAVGRAGDPNPNATFRADGTGGGVRRARGPVAERRPALAGDLIPGSAGEEASRPQGRMMFPDYWTEDDAVYAAEQAYLHAVRHGGVGPVPGRPGAYTWVGEYGGVRIEGDVLHGEFTGFRPAEDQSGLTVPRHVPRPPEDTRRGPGFAQRAVDISRFGDRRTRTGVHQEPSEDLSYGLLIHFVRARDNGTYVARVQFLDPDTFYRINDLTADKSAAFLDSRWKPHVDGLLHTMFPAEWGGSEVLDAVEAAHVFALRRGAVAQKPGDGSYRWVGESRGVRIEGIVRGGYHVAFRPTYEQPRLRWPGPDDRPVAVTAPVTERFTRGTADHALDLQYVLYASGQLGVQLTARIAFVAAEGVGDEAVSRYAEAFQGAATELFGGSARPDGAPLIRLSVDIADEGQAHQTVTVTGDRDAARIRAELPLLLGVSPDAAELAAVARAAARFPAEALKWQAAGARVDEALRRSRPAAFLETSDLEEPDRHADANAWEPVETRAQALLTAEVVEAFAPGVVDAVRAGGRSGGFPAGWHWAEALYMAAETRSDPEAVRYPGVEPRTELMHWMDDSGFAVELTLANGKIAHFTIEPAPSAGGFQTGPPHAPADEPTAGASDLAAASMAGALLAADWQDSTYSVPDKNGEKACVEITVVTFGAGRAGEGRS